ncbi:MAG: 50S ribosomal protein L11 methyltransferase [Candidatus Eisenbacteria bacterium]|nr:50S ribosomal protein L11 methyltransferase [Candidatus Eisenbacteria bacterium]
MSPAVPPHRADGTGARGYPERVMTEDPSLQLMLVRTSEPAAEALEALLEEMGVLGSAVERRRGARLVLLQAYFPGDAIVPLEWAREKLRELRANGVPVGPAEVRARPMRGEDWAESWKRHFKAIRATERLIVLPSWEEAPAGEIDLIRLDPGMAFGLGDHPTTRGCLELMERLRPGDGDLEGRFATADVRTGTGILAIRAVQLGLGPVEAFDTEADAARSARENAERNGVAAQIEFREGTMPPRGAGPYRWVLANILLGPLETLMPRMSRSLVSGGELVAAGILAEQEDRFAEACAGAGFKVVDRICERAQRGARRWPVLLLRKRRGLR